MREPFLEFWPWETVQMSNGPYTPAYCVWWLMPLERPLEVFRNRGSPVNGEICAVICKKKIGRVIGTR